MGKNDAKIPRTPTLTPEELSDPKKRLEHSVNLFLSVVPEALRSSYEQEELGHEQVYTGTHKIKKNRKNSKIQIFDHQFSSILNRYGFLKRFIFQYLRDAHTAFRDAMKKTKRFNWPNAVKSAKSTDEEVPQFYPGSFIYMLLNKVCRIL